jgi:hypothetical protein
MRLLLSLPLLALLACAHSPAPPPGPRPLGMDGSLLRGEARVDLRFRYEVVAPRELTLLVELGATGSGSVGAVRVAVEAEGFEVVGDPSWTGELVAGVKETRRFVLRPRADGVGTLTIAYGMVDAPAPELVPLRFLTTPEQIRPCQAADEECGAGGP